MEKYDDMNKVSATVRSAPAIKKHKRFGPFKTLLVQTAISAALALLLLAGKILPVPYYAEITGAVKTAVGFDVLELIGENLPGD